jgi:hypothetical protein
MNVIIFGATGMECCANWFTTTFWIFPRLRVSCRDSMPGFFCLGVSSGGMAEDEHRRVTYDITMAAAQTVPKPNPDMTFILRIGRGD